MERSVGKVVTYYLTEASEGKTGFLASLWGILMGYAKENDVQIYEALKKSYPAAIASIEKVVAAEEAFFKSSVQYAEEYPRAKAEYLKYVGLAAYYAQLMGLIEDITDLLEKLKELEIIQSEQDREEEEDSTEYEREGYFEIEFR